MTSDQILAIEDRWQKGQCTSEDVRLLLNEIQTITKIKAEPFVAGVELGTMVGRTIYIRPDTQDEMAYREVAIGNEYQLPPRFKPDDIIIDVGANIGAFALACISRGCKKVYCFEPEEENFKVLIENTRDLPQVSAYNLAVWRSDLNEPVKIIRRAPHETAACYTNPGEAGEKVDSIGMDKILSKLPSVRLLKIDAEGAEWPIFLTSTKFDSVQEIACELHFNMKHTRFPTDKDKVCERLKQFGFECEVILHPKCPDMMAHLWARRTP